MSGQYVRYPLPVRAGLSPAWLVVTRSCSLLPKGAGKPRKKDKLMANKLTRKGLAGVAALALVSAGFISAPANAAGEVTLAVEAGTGTTGILGDSFYVKASLGSSLTSTANARLKFEVTNSTGASLTYTTDNAPASDNRTNYSGTETVDGSAATASSGTADVVYDAAGSASTQQVLGISSAATAGHSVTVVAFVDDNLNDIKDDAFVSSAITINFVKLADAGFSLALTAPQVGETALSATVTSSVVNLQQIDIADYGVEFGYYNSGVATAQKSTETWGTVAGVSDLTAVALNTAKTALTSTLSSLVSSPVAASSTQLAQLWSGQTGTWAKVGSLVAGSASAVQANASESEAYWVANANVSATGVIRDAITTATLEVYVADVTGAVVANKVVTLTTDSGNTGTHKINDVTVADSTAYKATTGADGIARFVVTSTTASATSSNDVTIASIKADGVTITSPGNLVWTAVSYTVVQEVQTATTDVQRFGVTGGTYTANVVVVDNWKQKLSSADFRIKYILSGRSVATAYDSLSDGVAAVAIADGSVGSGSTTTAKFSLEKLTSGSWAAHTDGSVVDMDGESGENNALVVNWYNVTSAVALNKDAVSSADLSVYAGRNTAKAGNTIVSTVTPTTIETTPDASAAITGTVKSSLGALLPGALVTVSGDANILFRVGTASGLGSLSFHTADGNISVEAYSNKFLTDSVVTVTSNGVSATTKLSFIKSRTDVGTSVVIDAPATVEPGSTLQATLKVVDKFGNAIDTDITATDFSGAGGTVKADGEDDADFRVTVTGPGISIGTLPTGTTSGSAVVNRLLGSKDTGSIVITVTYGGADAVIGTGDDDITATKTITVGAAPAAAKVNVGSFNGKLVVYANGHNGKKISWKVGGKWGSAVATSDTARFARVTPRKGVTVSVQIYVDGVLTLTKSVVTK